MGNEGSRIAGVDYGTKRIGIAISDPLRIFAQPVGTFDAAGAIEALKQYFVRDGIEIVVIGWPLSEDGTENDSTRRVDQYVRRIRNALRGVRIVRWDERYTSEAVRDSLHERQPGRPVAGRVDTAVAGLILQEYLDQHGREASS